MPRRMAKASKAARVTNEITKHGVRKSQKKPVVAATKKTALSKVEKAKQQKEAKKQGKAKLAEARAGVKDMDA